MKSLSKDHLAERARLVQVIRDAHASLESTIEWANEQAAELRSEVEADLADLNEALADADRWLDEVRAEMDAVDSDGVPAFDAWKEEFYGYGDRIKVKYPEAIKVPECDVAETLEALPVAPEKEG